MSGRMSRPFSGPAVLLFGPLALSFDEAAFKQLRDTVTTIEDNAWIPKAIKELPDCWKTVTSSLPELKYEHQLRHLEDVKNAFETGCPLKTTYPLPNTILIPLVVIAHLTQYEAFLKRTTVESDDRIDLFASSKQGRETIGFCTGLLSAVAISSSGSTADFLHYGAVAIRLAMLIGMVVDAQDIEVEESRSLSAVWNSPESGEQMMRIVESFPGVRNPPVDFNQFGNFS